MDKNQTDINPPNNPSQNQITNPNHENFVQQTTPKPPAQPEYVPPVNQPSSPIKSGSNPGLIVLQWLTYAFWGGTVVAMSTLTALVLTFFLVADAEIGESSLYVMAIVIVLLPISVICDFFYSKHEPEKKTGFAAVVMILHAILFAFFGIGSLIVAAWSIMNLIISSSETEGTMAALYSSLIIAFLFAILFLRTLLPKKLYKLRRYFIILMIIIVGIICTFGILGPVAETRLTRNDRLIESNLETVSAGINSYATNNNKLPDSLNSLKLTGDAKKLVTENLVTYKQNSGPSLINNDLLNLLSLQTSSQAYYYQLCVTYQKASTYQSDSESNLASIDNNYQYNISTYSHPAGEKCYLLTTSDYSSNNDLYDTPQDTPTNLN